jgi:hypothetical protein
MYDHLVFIQQQLKQRKIEPALQQFYRIELPVGKSQHQFYAYNELLFLTNAGQLPPGTLIQSDSRARRIPFDIQSRKELKIIQELYPLNFHNRWKYPQHLSLSKLLQSEQTQNISSYRSLSKNDKNISEAGIY